MKITLIKEDKTDTNFTRIGVGNPQLFRISHNLKKVLYRFLPEEKRYIDGTVTSKLSKNIEVEWFGK